MGRTSENYRIREVAAIVEEVVPGSRITFAQGAGPDLRNYRVDCDKLARTLPGFQPRWTVRSGVEELLSAYLAAGLTAEDVTGSRYLRIRHIEGMLGSRIDPSLRWLRSVDAPTAVAGA